MALWELDEFQGPQFLGFVRAVPIPEPFVGVEILPVETVFDLEIEHIRGAINRPVMASVITYDAEAPIGGKPGLGEKIVQELPPIKRKERISEKEIIRFLTPRAGTPDKQIAINTVYNVTRRMLDSVQARIEWLRWQAISEPTLAYDEDGVKVTFDYGFNPALQIDVDTDLTTGVYWDLVATANPVADLQEIQEIYEDETGALLQEMWVSKKAINFALRNDAMRDLIRGAGAASAQLAPSEMTVLFDLYQLPNLRSYDTKVNREELDGTITELRPLDLHKGVGLPSFSVGNTIMGPTAESSALYGTPLATEAPGVWAQVFAEFDPPTQWVKAAAISFPSIPDAQFVVQAELLSGAV